MAAMCVQFQNCEQRGKLCFIRPPRQQPRLLKYHADPCACRTRHAALIVMVETGEDLQHGALAAPGRTDEHADLAGSERKAKIGEHVEPLAGRVCECFACDIVLLLDAAATEI